MDVTRVVSKYASGKFRCLKIISTKRKLTAINTNGRKILSSHPPNTVLLHFAVGVLFVSFDKIHNLEIWTTFLFRLLQAATSINYTWIHFLVGSIPLVSPPSETVKLNRTSSVNLTCIVSGQPGFRMNWYKNRNVIPPLPLSQIHRTPYVNGSVKSVLTLNRVKYKDRRSIISCSAWYPTLSINSTRNIHLLVHGNTC